MSSVCMSGSFLFSIFFSSSSSSSSYSLGFYVSFLTVYFLLAAFFVVMCCYLYKESQERSTRSQLKEDDVDIGERASTDWTSFDDAAEKDSSL